MAMRASGINSGLDTDAIVKELVSAYSKKTEKYEKEQTKLGWKQEIWKNLNTKVNSLYKSVGDMRYSSAYSLRKVTSSDTTKASVSASSGAVNGTQKLNVLSTAQSCYLTGGKLKHQKAVTNPADGSVSMMALDGELKSDKTTLAELGFNCSGESATFCVKMTNDSGEEEYKEVTLKKDTTIDQAVAALQKAGVNASFDENNGRIYVSSKGSGKNSNFSLLTNMAYTPDLNPDGSFVKDNKGNVISSWKEVAGDHSDAESLLTCLGLNETATGDQKATKIEGDDAVIVLNGVVYTGDTNSFSINGLNINVNGVTDDITACMTDGKIDPTKVDANNSITINTTTDTQGIYDKIKDFLTSYNSIINEITKMYNADSASDYQPLTDEEKDAMSDTEIEKWETKIKSSLLRRDNSLSSIMNAMMTSMSGAVTIDGKNYSLSTFGIHTLGYLNAVANEQNAYHIDGDGDDQNTADKEDELMKAINSDPDTVVEFMKQLCSNLYKAIDDQMQSSDLRTRYCIYNDKEMDKQYTNYTKTIKSWEEKVSDKEEYYYNKFTQMETALAKLNSQTSSLSSMLGS